MCVCVGGGGGGEAGGGGVRGVRRGGGGLVQSLCVLIAVYALNNQEALKKGLYLP